MSASTQFAHYARYYDLLYQGKDYAAEAAFVNRQVRSALRGKARELLELGCGTGRHALALTDLRWKVQGVDLSPTMVEQAQQRAAGTDFAAADRPSFAVGNINQLRLNRRFDAAVSIFHVIGYQTSNEALAATFARARAHLRPGGVFFFDYWFGPAVLTERPSVRTKRFEDDRIVVHRVSTPVLDLVRNTVTVSIQVEVTDKQTGRARRLREKHRVRYFFIPELEQMLAHQGLMVVGHGQWMNRRPLDDRSWYGWMAAKHLT